MDNEENERLVTPDGADCAPDAPQPSEDAAAGEEALDISATADDADAGDAAEPADTPADLPDPYADVPEETRNEMEGLAKLVKEELARTTAEFAEAGEAEDGDPEENEPHPLCSLCGENEVDYAADPETEYCADCRRKLVKTKLSPVTVLAPILVLAATVAVIWLFTTANPAILDGAKARFFELTGRLNEAVDAYNEVLDDLADVKTGSEFFSSATQTVTENLAVLSYRKGDFGNATDYVKQVATSENDISIGKTARFREVASRIVVINTELDRDYEMMSPYLSDYYADYDSCHNLLAARRNELLAGE
ncbi:MAG: hypothetical protein K6F67_05935, partial [Oscillospiraceae bacterium]|nr:hypothetical protein [Oscillospiraceae bacterium]